MQGPYPDLTFGTDPLTGFDAFGGTIPLLAPKSGLVRRIHARIVFPPDYPHREPRAFDAADRFLPHTGARHFYPDGRCCLWLPWDSQWQGHRQDALLDFMAQLVIFFNHQLVYDVSGKWPVAARGHGPDGYREFLAERLAISEQELPKFIPMLTDGARVAYTPCPCGSGKQAKRCHLAAVNQLISQIGRRPLRDRVLWINEMSDAISAARDTTGSSEKVS